MSVPLYRYNDATSQLKDWAIKQSDIQKYWENKNQKSIDGLNTNILEKTHKPLSPSYLDILDSAKIRNAFNEGQTTLSLESQITHIKLRDSYL